MIRKPSPIHTFLAALGLAIKQISVAAAWAACAICMCFALAYNLFALVPFAMLFLWFGASMSRTLHQEELARIQALRDLDEDESS